MKEKYLEKIRDLREGKQLTQEVMAKQLGTSQTMYSRYERGVNELPIRLLREICEFYEVSADYLLGLPMKEDGQTFHEMPENSSALSEQAIHEEPEDYGAVGASVSGLI